MKLVIVESPTKCHTIKKFLGKDYEVIASKGHIRDLATSGKGGLGVDIAHDFKPTYIINKDKTSVVNTLKKAKKDAEEVYLATDPDREGEAISWHLAEVLDLDVSTTKRLEFHEITKKAVDHAIENYRTIDMDLVTSQETRRIIDRIMGFELSSLLKNKIHSLSAGRVQSVTLKLIVDRENEFLAFVPEEYYVIKGVFDTLKGKLDTYMGNEITIKSENDANKILDLLKDKDFVVVDKKDYERKGEAPLPFRTSSLQQAAFNKYHFTTKATQSYAQKLFESGLITYIRTEGIGYAEEFVVHGKKYVESTFGKEYLASQSKYNSLKTKDDNKLAHEAIRPTSLENTPESLKETLTGNLYKLYKLIYDRSLASLMAPRIDRVITLYVDSCGYTFKIEEVNNTFDGFSKVTKDENKEEDKNLNLALKYNVQDKIKADELIKEQHFTKGPTRYNEARLVKMMEDVGIGRPSTYASTISTLLERDYVKEEKGILIPTDQGKLTVERLASYFPEFMDTSFTAKMEQELDDIHAKDGTREKVLTSFYNEFEPLYKKAQEEMPKLEVEYSGNICPQCGSKMVFRKSRYGVFEACSNYPKCKYIVKEEKEKKELVYSDELCPKCGKPLVERKSKRGTFLACSGFPECTYIKGQEEKEKKEVVYSDKLCPKCGAKLIIRKGVKGKSDFLGCSRFPKCRYSEAIKEEK